MKQISSALLLLLIFQITGKTQNTFPASGNVGIGTTTPGTNLVVNGNTRILSHLTIGSNEDPPVFMPLMIKGSAQIGLNDISQPTDQRLWVLINQGSKFRIITEKEDFSAVVEAMVITRTGLNINTTYFPNGNVGIGTSSPGTFKLAVEGKIGAREVRVTNTNPWPDYIFDKNYKKLPLAELEKFIQRNNHLPNIPTAKEIKENGIELGVMNAKLLEKIEELTLYLIELKKQNQLLEKRIDNLETNMKSHHG